MRHTAGLVLVATFFLTHMSSAAEPSVPEGTVIQEIAPGRRAEIKALDLEMTTAFRLQTGDVRLDIRVTPDGMVQLVGVAVDVEVSAVGTEGNRVTLRLPRGSGVSVWPMERVLVTGGQRGFALEMTAAGWAFVVRADNVGPQGLSATCDGATCKLYEGQRLDADRKGSRVVFRAMRDSYPGSIVERRVITRPPRRPRQPAPRMAALSEGTIVDDALPGLLPTAGRDLTWQATPLPLLRWEVFRPADVSP